MAVGLVTSAKFTPPILQAFYAGIRAKGFEADPFASPGGLPRVNVIPIEADGKYDDGDGGPGKRQELYNIIQNWNADPTIDLIVAVGGLVSAHAAMKFGTKPFLLMYGTAPKFALAPNPNLRGAVDLDLIGSNESRHDDLCTRYGITNPKKVCLIWSANSKMGKVEKKAWKDVNGWPHEKVNKNQDNDIAQAVRDAKTNGAKAVVISGDPYFTSRKDILVAAVNASGLKYCYPFDVYKTANPPPAAGSGVIFGPDLGAGYSLIGEKTGTILAALAAGQPVPNTGVTPVPTGHPQPVRKKGKSTAAKKSK